MDGVKFIDDDICQPPWTFATICTTDEGLIPYSDRDAESSSSGFPETISRNSAIRYPFFGNSCAAFIFKSFTVFCCFLEWFNLITPNSPAGERTDKLYLHIVFVWCVSLKSSYGFVTRAGVVIWHTGNFTGRAVDQFKGPRRVSSLFVHFHYRHCVVQ